MCIRDSFSINPPYDSIGESIGSYLGAVGIRTRIRTMERATFASSWSDRKLHGLLFGGVGTAGNAATRIQALATTSGQYAMGVLPEVQDLSLIHISEPTRLLSI